VTNVVKFYKDQYQTWDKHLQDDYEQRFVKGEDAEKRLAHNCT
jgi:hypothetical protein